MDKAQREKIVKARDAGFKNALSHLPPDKVEKLTKSYQRQAANREKNYNEVRRTVVGGDGQ